jgi:hypothetical protein
MQPGTQQPNILCDLVHLHDVEVRRIQRPAAALREKRVELKRLMKDHPSGYEERVRTLRDDIQRVTKEVEAMEVPYLLDACPLLNRNHDIVQQLSRDDVPHATRALLKDEQQRLVARFKQQFRPDLLTDVERQLLNPQQYAIEHANGSHRANASSGTSKKRKRPSSHSAVSRTDAAVATTVHCTYKRLNHFREFLRQLQGKSRVDIPVAVIQRIREELRKHRYTHEDPALDQTHLVRPPLIRKILRKLQMPRYYEHIPTITHIINPTVQPLSIPPHKEEILAFMFRQTEAPYDQTKRMVKKTRKNFMSYPYVSYKLCELLGWKKYLRHFNLLKSETLLIYQDRWWKLVCERLNWQFMKTIGSHRVSPDELDDDDAAASDEASGCDGDAA